MSPQKICSLESAFCLIPFRIIDPAEARTPRALGIFSFFFFSLPQPLMLDSPRTWVAIIMYVLWCQLLAVVCGESPRESKREWPGAEKKIENPKGTRGPKLFTFFCFSR